MNFNYEKYFRDDLRTANIICDDIEGVTCLVIDRETFNQLISNLDEIRTKYVDEETESKLRYNSKSLIITNTWFIKLHKNNHLSLFYIETITYYYVLHLQYIILKFKIYPIIKLQIRFLILSWQSRKLL